MAPSPRRSLRRASNPAGKRPWASPNRLELWVCAHCPGAPGEAQGLSDMRRALALAVVQGLGRDAASLYNNLALVVWQYEGPAAALVLCDEASSFASGRGIAGMATWIATQRLTFMAACGPSERTLRTSNSWQRTAKRQAIRLSLRLARSSSLFEADVAREPTPPPRNNLWRSPAGPAAQS